MTPSEEPERVAARAAYRRLCDSPEGQAFIRKMVCDYLEIPHMTDVAWQQLQSGRVNGGRWVLPQEGER